jgi:hypothetical protein
LGKKLLTFQYKKTEEKNLSPGPRIGSHFSENEKKKKSIDLKESGFTLPNAFALHF